MDSGTSSHLSNNQGILSSSFTSPSPSHIIVDNGSSLPIVAYGTTTFPSLTRPLHLSDVLVSPELIANLISVHNHY